MAKAQAVAAGRKKTAAARTAANPAGAPATQAEADAAAQVAEAIEEAKNGGKKPEPASKVEPEKQAAAPAQAPTVEKAEKAVEPEKQAAAPTQTTTPTAEKAEKAAEPPVVVKVFVGRGPGTPGWDKEYAGLTEAGAAKKFAVDLANMAGDISLAERRIVKVNLNLKGFSIVHCAGEEVAKKLIAIPEAKKAEKGFVSNRRKPAMISLYVQKPSAFQPTEEVAPMPMSAKLMDGAKGAEKLQEARKTAPQAAVQVNGGSNGNDPRRGRPVPKTSDQPAAAPEEIDFHRLSWWEEVKCVVSLKGMAAAYVMLQAILSRVAAGTGEHAKTNALLIKWGGLLGVKPQLVFINEDGTVRFELLTDSIARFFKAIVVSKEPRRVVELLADAKACNHLRPDQIAMLTEMVSTEIAKLNEAEKQAALTAQAKAEAKAEAAKDELEAMRAELAKLRATAAAKTKAEPTAEDVAKKAAEEISPASTTPATVQ